MKIRGSLLVCPSTAPNSDVRKFLGPQCSLSALAICHQPRRWPAISGLATSSKMSQVGEVLGGANEVRDNETVTTSRAAMPRPRSSYGHFYFAEIRTFELCRYRIRSTLWYVVGAHLSLQIRPNGSEPANDPRVESDAIRRIKPNSVPRDDAP